MRNKNTDKTRNWHLISARGQVLGRLSTNIARLLIGKHKRTYMPNLDEGDFVVVTDARAVVLTGNKDSQKTYQRYSGYPGGRKVTPVSKVREKFPERIIEYAVKGMLPDNKLKRERMKRLKVVAGSEHPFGDKFKQ